MRVLGIETSCDETGIAIYDGERGLLSHALYSQIPVHAEYGGVVPELASRDHVRKTLPLIRQVLSEAKCALKDIDGIAYTAGPGLIGALLVGSAIGRSLAWSRGIPAIGVHHMEGHLLAPMLEENPPQFPFLALLVSGGHTLLVQVNKVGDYHILGDTLDDAVGEAFDKTAKLLGLPYPGGPELARLAELGDGDRFHFPRPMTNRPGLDFSFSGLKTFAMNTWRESEHNDQAQIDQTQIDQARIDQTSIDQTKADIARAFQDAVVDTLAIKCRRALKQTDSRRLIVAGGVGANQALRQRLEIEMKRLGGKVFYPRPLFCTDNGAMIAYAGYQRLVAGEKEPLAIKSQPRWSLDTLSVPD